jgi:hypothetical protein
LKHVDEWLWTTSIFFEDIGSREELDGEAVKDGITTTGLGECPIPSLFVREDSRLGFTSVDGDLDSVKVSVA